MRARSPKSGGPAWDRWDSDRARYGTGNSVKPASPESQAQVRARWSAHRLSPCPRTATMTRFRLASPDGDRRGGQASRESAPHTRGLTADCRPERASGFLSPRWRGTAPGRQSNSETYSSCHCKDLSERGFGRSRRS